MTESRRAYFSSSTLSSLQRLYDKFVHSVFDFCLWFLWRHKRGMIHGQLPDFPFVLVSNHGSYLDWLLLHVVIRRKFGRGIIFLAKKKVATNPVFGPLVRDCKAVVVDDLAKSKAIILDARVFKNSNPESPPIVGIFPEGTRSRTGEPMVNSSGAAWLARNCGLSIVPVALCGFWETLPPRRKIPRFSGRNLSVHILSPVNPSRFTNDQATIDHAMESIYEIVRPQRKAPSNTVAK